MKLPFTWTIIRTRKLEMRIIYTQNTFWKILKQRIDSSHKDRICGSGKKMNFCGLM